jgi:hypothetical protein
MSVFRDLARAALYSIGVWGVFWIILIGATA